MKDYTNLIVIGVIFFIILISMQYSLNKIILLLKEIKEILLSIRGNHYK